MYVHTRSHTDFETAWLERLLNTTLSLLYLSFVALAYILRFAYDHFLLSLDVLVALLLLRSCDLKCEKE